jgi:hypothetical protein
MGRARKERPVSWRREAKGWEGVGRKICEGYLGIITHSTRIPFLGKIDTLATDGMTICYYNRLGRVGGV